MEFRDKRILVICKETYSYPLYYLSRKWMEDNIVAAFFINPSESQYNKCLLNDTTYYKFKELGIPVYTSDDIAVEFTENLNSPKVDIELLKRLEEKYSHYKNFNQQILSTQYFTRHYHYRNYMKTTTYNQQMFWLQLNYKNIEGILDDFRPEIIIDTDCAELGRTVLSEIAYNRSVPYMTIEYPRYEMYKTISFQAGYGVDSYFNKMYEECLALSDNDLEDETNYVVEFRKKSNIMSKEYSGDITSSYNPLRFSEICKRMVGHISYFLEQDFKKKNHKLKKSNPILYPDFWEYIKFYWNYYNRKNKLMKHNNFFINPQTGDNYVYMPLHLIPESSTFVKAPFYINELDIISAVSKALPIGWKLYVKEHQAMVGERGEDFYEKVNSIPNAQMVQLNYYKDPKPWIENAQCVITITGTSAYEAVLMGKEAFVFGDVMFDCIDGITRVKSYEELPALFDKLSDKPINNVHCCAAYIRAVKNVGKSINMKQLLNLAFENLRENREPNNSYMQELEKLEQLYLERYFDYVKTNAM